MKNVKKIVGVAGVCVGLMCFAVEAGDGRFWTDALFSDNAVLQRGVEVPVNGTGKPGSGVTVSFAGQRVSAKVGKDGKWSVKLAPMPESVVGHDLVVQCGEAKLVSTNVLVGEVFLCSGQSNMQQPLWSSGWGDGFSDRKGVIESKIARWPLFRYVALPRPGRTANNGFKVEWRPVVSDGKTAGISAICYYFATTLLRAEPGVPVGIVNSSKGGSKIESWLPGGDLYESMITPLGQYRFRAALWYQGESNVRDGARYTGKLHALAKGWRDALKTPALPFIISEIAPYEHGKNRPLAPFWRAQQRFAEEDEHAVCVPINDCGDLGTVHPDRKELPAVRYAAIVLNRFYGRKDVPCAIPRAVRALADAGGALVEFENVKTLGVNSYPKYVKHEIPGFELCGEDGTWHKAKAEIDGNRIRVFTSKIQSPGKVRYLGGEAMMGEVYSADSNFVPSAFELDVEAVTIDAEMQRKRQAAIANTRAERTAWFREARFGMFIHWGLYSIPARGEWIYARHPWQKGEYEALAGTWNPSNFNPRTWAKLAKAAGMKYAVLTTRHHDGFCMFDSRYTDYKITKTPFGRDVTREYADAFRAEGLKVGFYHSLPDWTHPGYADPESPDGIQGRPLHKPTPQEYAAFKELLFNHVRQLMTDYGTIDLLFLDYTSRYKAHEKDFFDGERILKMVYELQPRIIVNDRLSFFKDNCRDFDYYTPEVCIPASPVKVKGREVTWETCATMNGCWGYRDDFREWRSPEALVAGLVGCVSRGGNLLLNVGPMADGSFPPQAVERLKALADWYEVNGEAVFGCGKSPFVPPFGCAYTQKGNILYCHFLQTPLGDVVLPGLKGLVAGIVPLRRGMKVHIVDEWGFELLGQGDQRIRPEGVCCGDVIKITLGVATQRAAFFYSVGRYGIMHEQKAGSEDGFRVRND